MSKADLLPCPFCGPGTELKLFDYPNGSEPETYIQCQNCSVIGPHHVVGEAAAIDAWNRRTPPASSGEAHAGGAVETEVRADGKTVRVDRWEVTVRRIVALLWGNRHEFEVDDVVEAVRKLAPERVNEDGSDDEGLVRAVLGSASPAGGAPAAAEGPSTEVMLDAAERHRQDVRTEAAAEGQAEPTEAMLIAARDWSHKKYGKPIGNDAAIGCWKAMIAAAPAPSGAEPVAWQVSFTSGETWAFVTEEPKPFRHYVIRPLFTRPLTAEALEAHAVAVMRQHGVSTTDACVMAVAIAAGLLGGGASNA